MEILNQPQKDVLGLFGGILDSKNNKFTAEELIKNAKIKDPGFDLYWLAIALERINGFKNGSADMFLLLEPAGFNDLVIFFNDWRKEIASNL